MQWEDTIIFFLPNFFFLLVIARPSYVCFIHYIRKPANLATQVVLVQPLPIGKASLI